MARPHRIVCYAVNGSGLGHVTRLLAVARWLRRLGTFLGGQEPELLFLTSTEATSLLSDARFAAFKLPSKGVARRAGLDVLEHRRLAKHFVWQTLQVFAPDLLVVDTFPQGSYDELLPVLDGPFKKALILRHVRPEFAARPVFQAALGLYDRVVVPHDTSAAADMLALLPPDRPTRCVGEVIALDEPDGSTRAALRAELGLAPGDPRALVYVSAGGGGDAGSEAALAALVGAVERRGDAFALVGAGPLYRGARLHGAALMWSVEPGVSRYFAACDAAVAAGGYNTFHELLFAGVPTAFYAQPKIADDQARRVAGAAAAGACLEVDVRDPGALDRALAALLDPAHGARLRAAARRQVPHNGAPQAAAEILHTLYGAAALQAAEFVTPRLAAALEAAGQPGAQLLGAQLTRLVPDGALASLEASAALEPLLPQLSPEAQAEVRRALAERSTRAERGVIERALLPLLAAAAEAGASELLPGLLDAALKKHPRQQEADRQHGAWVSALCGGLGELLRAPPSGVSLAGLAALYRVFPRLADAGAADTFALFRRVVEHSLGRGDGVEELSRRLQVVKLGQRRVLSASLGQLLEGGAP